MWNVGGLLCGSTKVPAGGNVRAPRVGWLPGKEFLKPKQDNLQTVTVSIAGSAEDSVSLYERYKTRAHSWGRFNPDVKRCLNYAPACIQLASCCTAEAGLITHGAGLNSPAAAASVSGSNTLKKKKKRVVAPKRATGFCQDCWHENIQKKSFYLTKQSKKSENSPA